MLIKLNSIAVSSWYHFQVQNDSDGDTKTPFDFISVEFYLFLYHETFAYKDACQVRGILNIRILSELIKMTYYFVTWACLQNAYNTTLDSFIKVSGLWLHETCFRKFVFKRSVIQTPHSRPQSCDPFGQCHGLRALVGAHGTSAIAAHFCNRW